MHWRNWTFIRLLTIPKGWIFYQILFEYLYKIITILEFSILYIYIYIFISDLYAFNLVLDKNIPLWPLCSPLEVIHKPISYHLLFFRHFHQKLQKSRSKTLFLSTRMFLPCPAMKISL